MKIAILGTRGIPNNYGGFEQLAQYLSAGLVSKGHEVYVYSSAQHPYQAAEWNGVKIIHCKDPENKIGTAGQFLYDLNCILDSRKRQFDAIINLGYTSSSVWMWLFDKKTRVITNMDGLEWKRSKYSKPVQSFLRYAEKLAVKGSSALVADSRAIQKYLQNKYNQPAEFIAYGADVFTHADPNVIEKFGLTPHQYNLLIARMEPENNIEMILDGAVASGRDQVFFVVGNTANPFGKHLISRYAKHQHIVFAGSIYDAFTVNNLRYYCHLYFHGHSVGGTNPSLLEAMACSSLVAAHDNDFNKSVLETEAFYFGSPAEVAALLQQEGIVQSRRVTYITANLEKIRKNYSWGKIVDDYNNMIS